MKAFFLILLSFYSLLISSCIVPESTHIAPNFYLLSYSNSDENYTVSKILNFKDLNKSVPSNAFYIKQVELPFYLDDSRIVHRVDNGEIRFFENERWGEPLEEGVGRVLGANLSHALNSHFYSVFPHRKRNGVHYEISISIDRFERVSNTEILLKGSWELYSKDFKECVHPLLNGQEIVSVMVNEREAKNSMINEVNALSESLNVFADRIASSMSNVSKSFNSDL